jgi:hypothetical protein
MSFFEIEELVPMVMNELLHPHLCICNSLLIHFAKNLGQQLKPLFSKERGQNSSGFSVTGSWNVIGV